MSLDSPDVTFDVDAAVDALETGQSPVALAERLGVRVADVRRAAVAATSAAWWRHNVVSTHGDLMLSHAEQMLLDGATLAPTARNCGLSVQTIRRRLTERNGQDWWDQHVRANRGGPVRLSDDDLLDAAALLEEGGTLDEASELLGVADETARRHLKDALGDDWYADNVTHRQRVDLTDDQLDDALARVVDEPLHKVASDLGVSEPTLGARLRAMVDPEWWADNVTTRRRTGRELRPLRERVTDHTDPDLLVGLFRDGVGVAEAADRTGTPAALAYAFLQDELGDEYHRTIGRAFRQGRGDVDLWLERLRDGTPFDQVVADAEVSEPSVRILLASEVGVDEYRALTGDAPEPVPHIDNLDIRQGG